MAGGLSNTELSDLLQKTSRTFALAIPLLPEPLATDVGAAYLLFRIADTFEDATNWDRSHRIRALTAFEEWLDGAPENFSFDAQRNPPVDDRACIDLVSRANAVLQTVSPPSIGIVKDHVKRTARAMRGFVEKQDDRGGLVLQSEDELVAYCYAVAGIVGEMLTALFARFTSRKLEDLMEDARAFGEGLQLVNILKDAESDARDGRVYIPKTLERAAVIARARKDLALAQRYVTSFDPTTPRGIITFCEVPRRLAIATLDALERGAPKLSREEVARIIGEVAGAG